jgi:hypothetical protein
MHHNHPLHLPHSFVTGQNVMKDAMHQEHPVILDDKAVDNISHSHQPQVQVLINFHLKDKSE